jgi:hypothetical protein
MKVNELIEILKQFPLDTEIEVNDNYGGRVYPIVSVDDFLDDLDYPVIMIQVNCD